MEQKRQLSAIMFTDISGYTALMQENEELAVKLRDHHRKSFKRLHKIYQGKIVQYFGDGTLSIFNSSLQAVRCAIALQQDMQIEPKVPLRIGMHIGDIIHTADDVIGDGVNLASRIEALSAPGSVLISGQLQYQIKNHAIATRSLGKFQLKNVMHPVEVFAVIADGLHIPNSADGDKVHNDKIAGDPVKRDQSIAILPFVNMSNDAEQEYFCDGMTEEIINSLSHLKNLKVIARTSAFMFKNKNDDVRKIGRELNVTALLEGSVRKSGNRVRVTSKLINVVDGSHSWSEKFDRELHDIFEIQDEISLAIVDALKIELLGGEREKVLDSKTQNIEAYNLYLKGQYEWYKRTKEGMIKSISLFKQTLAIDPQYTLAQVGIANAYIAMCDWGEMTPSESLPTANHILREAMKKDNTMPEIYAALAYHDLCNYDMEGYWRNYNITLELDPGLPVIHHLDAVANHVLGNFERAIESNQLARNVDPLSLIFNFAHGHTFFLSSEYEKAIDQFNYTLSLEKDFKPASLFSMYCHIQLGHHAEAVESMKSIIGTDRATALHRGKVDEFFSTSGIKGVLQYFIDEGLAFYSRLYNQPYHQAICYAILNETDKMFELLETLYENRSFRLTFFKSNPIFGKFKTDPRYQQLVYKIGIWRDLV